MSSDEKKPKRGRPQKLDAEGTLDVALQAYWEEDPADVSLNAICQRAGVSKPSLYREFGSEDGLMLAALNRYAEKVLSDIFVILTKGMTLQETLDALIQFASHDPRMEKGCLFYKMRAGKHRLGPQTRERVEEIDAAAIEAHEAFLKTRREAGDWNSVTDDTVVARYLVEQIGLALTQRAAGEDPGQIEQTIRLAFSAIQSG